MKRGFLNRPGALSMDKKSSPNTAEKHAPPAKSLKVPMIFIPTGRIRPPDTIDPDPLAVYKNRKTCWHLVTLPLKNTLPLDHRMSVCILLVGAKDQILATPSFPGPQIPVFTNTRISSVPGAGLGMFATRDFSPGELVLIERPLLVFPHVFPHSPGVTIPREQLFDTAVSGLEYNDRRAFAALSNCKGSDTPVLGIVDTNALDIGILPGPKTRYAAVFRDISRINHSCSPNVYGYWDLKTFAYVLRALRPILAGEQIYITYCSPLRSRANRRQIMSSKYGFKCMCTSCNLPDLESAKSDSRRVYLGSYALDPADESGLKAWVRNFSLPDEHIITECKMIWELMEMEEGCGYPEELWPALVQSMCKAYCALGDLKGAREWAKKGVALSTAFIGNDGGWMKVFETPQNTAWWGLRVKARALLKK